MNKSVRILIAALICLAAKSVAENSINKVTDSLEPNASDLLLQQHNFQDAERTGRSSPSASIAAYITNYNEKKRLKELRKKKKINKTKKPYYPKKPNYSNEVRGQVYPFSV